MNFRQIHINQFTPHKQNRNIEENNKINPNSDQTMSKVAKNIVSTIIERDKVLIENGGSNRENQNRMMAAIQEDVETAETKGNANYWVNQLALLPHPFMEETYFKETFIDPQIVQVKKNEDDENAKHGADEMTR